MDMSQKPEGATHYSESYGRWYKLDSADEWFFCMAGAKWEHSNDLNGGDGVPDLTSITPTLETMLAEWRDLEARAQAAQAEADALFEHAGQCHGEIVVRLAELGWGVPGEPVVTLDEPINIQKGDVVELLDRGSSTILKVGNTYTVLCAIRELLQLHDGANWVNQSHVRFISRPSTQP